MSYDLEIATHGKPTREQVETWADTEGLAVSAADADCLTIEKPTKRGDEFVCTLDGPHSAEPEDFAEELAAACLAPRWMLSVSVPFSSPKTHFAKARSLARYLAAQNDGAAFDPQDERVVWPRGKRQRVPPRAGDETTSKVGLEWFLPPSRWQSAPEKLIRLLRRRCPEALPTRYGQFEPPQYRLDNEEPGEFVRFLLDNEDGDAFWFASRPCFGGSYFAPHSDKYAPPEDDPYRVAHFEIDFDGRVLEADPPWRETIVELFLAAAIELGAFYAAAQVEPGWTVTRSNRLYMTAENLWQAEHFLRGRLWQGLPPVPLWLSWYGHPYSDLVRGRLAPEPPPERGKLATLGRRLRGSGAPRDEPVVVDREDGLFLRLSEKPRARDELVPVLPPNEFTYRHRPPTEDRATGAMTWNPAERDDRAEVIPPLDG